MEQTQGPGFRRFVVLAVVLGGHVLLVLWVSSRGPADTRKGASRPELRTVLMLLDMELPAQEPSVKQTAKTPPPATVSRTRPDRSRKTSSKAPSEDSDGTSQSTAITAPDQSGAIPQIDWLLEMEAGARAVEPKMSRGWQRKCDEAERTRAPRPRGCNRRSYDKPWRPSGSFAQDMRDPDRPFSSVPDPLGDPFLEAPRAKAFKDEE